MEASKKLVCVFVDCDWGKKNNDLSDKFKVQGYPTVVFCDPDGNQVASLGSRDPAGVATQITEVAKKYSKAGFESYEKAIGAAKEEKKLILYVFVKPNVASSLSAAVADESLKDLVGKFVVAHSEISKESADAKAFSVSESTLLVLDPAGDPKAKPLLKLTGKKELKEVRKQLEATLKKFEDGGGDK
jgi:hypothetical protein